MNRAMVTDDRRGGAFSLPNTEWWYALVACCLAVIAFISSLIVPAEASAVEVSGYVSSSTTWTVANSPYVVTGNLIVMNGATLTIEAGVTVTLNAKVNIQIDDATVIAQGTSNNPITITSSQATPAAGDWGYLLFNTDSTDATFDGSGNYSGGSILEYVVLEYGGDVSVTPKGALLLNGAHPYINHCTVRNNLATGIYGHTLDAGELRIDDTVVENNNGGGIYAKGGTVAITNGVVNTNAGAGVTLETSATITNTTVNNNSGTGISLSGSAGIWVITDSTVRFNKDNGILVSYGTLTVTNSVLRNNGGIGVSATGATTITGNAIVGNLGGGLYLSNAATVSDNIIAKNMASNGAGIYVKSSYPYTIANNTITGNAASTLGGGIYVATGASAVITGNTISANSAPNASALYYQGADNQAVQHNTIIDNTASGSAPTYTLYLKAHPLFNYNNLDGNTATYELWNANSYTTADLDASGNWWGTGIDTEVTGMIHDGLDDSLLGLVDYSAYASAILTDAPISAPANVLASMNNDDTVTVSWDANSESDVAGYRVYWSEILGYPYAHFADAGNVTTHTLSGLSTASNYGVTVTSYDTGASAVVDDPATIINERQSSGHESWYAAEQQAVFAPSLPLASQDDYDYAFFSVDLLLDKDLVVAHDLYLSGGTLDLNGHTLTVGGSVYHSGGTMLVNGGKVMVAGEYRLQTKSGSGTYSVGSGKLIMQNAADWVEVGGNFVTESNVTHSGQLTDGTLTVKGDFTQKGYNYNFTTSGTHKVVLAGTGLQTVSMEDPSLSYAHFSTLEITNSSSAGVVFATSMVVSTLVSNGHAIQVAGVGAMNWTVQSDVTITGDLTVTGATMNLNGHTVTVTGSVIHAGGTIQLGGGKLVVAGDYRLQTKAGDGSYGTSAGYLQMVNSADTVEVGGSFVTDSTVNHGSHLTAGILTVKGDFTQKGYNYNFATSGTHKVVLAGTAKQMVTLEDPSASYAHFTMLEITNASTAGVVLASSLVANMLTSNGHALTLNTGSAISGALQDDLAVIGDLLINGNTFDLNGHTVTVSGSVYHAAGTMAVNGGHLTVQGDYRLQTKSAVDGTYSTSSGLLQMVNTADTVEVGGSFVTDSTGNHASYLTAGTLSVTGDFTQQGYHSNFRASGTHTVVLAGTGKQTVSLEDPSASYSHFNTLEITNASTEGVVFSSSLAVTTLTTNGHPVQLAGIGAMDWTLHSDVTVTGDLTISGAIVNLNGHTLTVTGNLYHAAGTMEVGGGTLVVQGDYRIQTKNSDGTYAVSSGTLKMVGAADVVRVDGSFVMGSSVNHSSSLTAGTLYVKGDFTQKHYTSSYNFATGGTHKVVLSGSGAQTVSLDDPSTSYSRFTILEIINKATDQVTFATEAPVAQLITSVPLSVSLGVQHRHWRYGSEADHIVDLVPGAKLTPLVYGDPDLAATLGAAATPLTGVTWNSADTQVVQENSDGGLTAVAPGQTTAQATVNGLTVTLTVNVLADTALPVMVLGNTGSGPGQYDSPSLLFAANDALYVADHDNKRIVVLDLTGNPLHTISDPASMGDINGLFVDQEGNLFVSDVATQQVHKFDSAGNHLLAMGSSGTAAGQFKSPAGQALDANGNLWVVDYYNHRLQQFDATTGDYLGGFGSQGSADSNLYYPTDVAVAPDGTLWVADGNKVKHFSADGGTLLGASASINPKRLWLDAAANLWVLSPGSGYAIRKFSPDLKELMNYSYKVDSSTENDPPAQLDNPQGIAVDGNGNLWVAEWDNNRVQRIHFITTDLHLSTAKKVVLDAQQVTATATYGVTADVMPTETVNDVAQWSLDNPSMATIDKGVLTAGKTGAVVVTADFDGFSDSLALDLLQQTQIEVSPNNTQDKAMPIQMAKAVKGNLNSYEEDWFKFTTTVAGYYRILFSSALSSTSTKITILDAGGTPIYDASYAVALAAPIFLEGQTDYYLKLVGGSTNENYLVSYTLTAAGEQSTPAASTDLLLGQTVTGIAAINSGVYYRLKLEGPRQLLINYTNPGSTTSMDITLYPEEISAETVLDQIKSTTGADAEIAIGLNQGTYYLHLVPSGNVDQEHYSLTVSPNILATAGEFEPNNTKPFTNTVENGKPVTARNYSSKDADFFTFHYAPDSESDFLTLDFTPKDNKGNHTITLLNLEDDTAILTFTSSNGKIITGAEFNLKPGQYFLRVKDSYSNRTEYQLTVNGKISAVKKVVGVSLMAETPVEQIQVNDVVPLTATVYFSDGSTVDNPSGLTWSCTAPPADMDVSTAGVVTIHKASSGSVVASYEGKVATLELSVGVVKKQSFGNLIIVAGGGIAPSNQLKEITQYLSDLAYQKFKGRGFGDDDIFYFNPIDFKDLDGNGFNDGIVDKKEITKAGFVAAISGWATDYPSTGPLYIYLNDHGANAQFQLYPNEVLTATLLKDALDTFQTATGRAVVVIIEACHSGTFVAPLMEGASNRVVITSADQGVAFLGDGGSASFSQFFMGSLYKGARLSQAYDAANQALADLGSPYATMYPQVAPETLASTAQDFYVVGNFALAPMFPEISQTTLASTFDASGGGTYTLQAAVTGVDNGKVWATIKPVNYEPPAVSGEFATPDIQLPMVDLLDADQEGAMDGVFDGAYSGFTGNGDYDVVIFARDAEGNISQTAVHKLTVTGLTGSNDYLNAGTGWSLMSSTIPFQVGDVFADVNSFTSVWKWAGGTWAVYLAGEGTPGAYASSKGFTQLAAINPGEGFWVNSKVGQQVTISGTPEYGALTFAMGWNLLGLKSTQGSTVAEIIAGQSGIASIWKWDGGTWAVSLPGEETPGSYAGSKGFNVLTTVNPGEGFWVNKTQ